MANETIGSVRCPIAGDLAEVRRDKRGKLYYLGAAGMIKPNLPSGQLWMRENANLDEAPKPAEEPNKPEPVPAPTPKPEPQPEPKPKPKRSPLSLLGSFIETE